VVRKRLAEADVDKGAFYCEFEFFKDIYRQKAREGSRTGQVVHLAMITMFGTKKKNSIKSRSIIWLASSGAPFRHRSAPETYSHASA
jgi:hypothetical protein